MYDEPLAIASESALRACLDFFESAPEATIAYDELVERIGDGEQYAIAVLLKADLLDFLV